MKRYNLKKRPFGKSHLVMTYAINYIDRRIYFKPYKSKVQYYWNFELKKYIPRTVKTMVLAVLDQFQLLLNSTYMF